MTEKIDLFKQYKDEYKAGSQPALAELSPAQYLTIEGQGAPGGKNFEAAIGALYSMAFTIKMTRKAAGLGDYVVAKLEADWCSDDGRTLDQVPQEQWRWAMMIRTPDCVKQSDLNKAVAAIQSKGKSEAVDRVVLQKLPKGRCVQIMHVGPYDQVGRAIEQMHNFIETNSLQVSGHHHEIYLSDPRRVEPERLKTILRWRVK